METTYTLEKSSIVLKVLNWIFGLLFIAVGIVNTFWGNDPGFGIFLLLLSLVYFIPVDTIVTAMTGITLPRFGLIKVVIALFIIWASVGVGELFDKIEIMLNSF